MKKYLSILAVLTVVVLLFIPSISNATVQDADTMVNDIYYKILSEENKTAEVIGIYNSEFKSQVEVPSSVEIEGETYTVVNIGESAFADCSTLKNITLPDNITSIGKNAFFGCSALTSITLPDGIISIEESAFNGCSELTSITLPNSITNIGDWTFASCRKLTSIILPNNITSIGEGTFCYCSELTSISLPNSVTNIGQQAFKSCFKLENITLPDNTINIGAYAFESCFALTSITLPDGIVQINTRVFSYCTSLETIVIPKSVQAIALDAFENSSEVIVNTYSGAYAETFSKENNIQYKLLDVKEPENTTIGYVTIGGNGNTLSGAEIPKTDNVYAEMKKVLNDKGYKTIYCAYELSATGNTKNGVELTFDLGTLNNGKNVMILHKKNNGSYEAFERTVENGKVKITVTEFSPFMVAIAETKPNSSGNNQNSGTTDTSNTETTEKTPNEKPTVETTVKPVTDNEPKTGSTDYTIVASILAVISLAGIIVLKLKK